jgi:ribosomal protein S18 acetylase RimI-like enzyme
LVRALEEEARRRGASRMYLEVRVDNAAAIRLYEKLGYRSIGRREDYYEDGAAALLFARELADVPLNARPKHLSRAA